MVRRAAHNEESAEVEVLFANMDKLKTLTKKIQGSLGRLETTGRSVQDAIRPVYGNTSKLQVTNANIERINEAINNIRKPLDRTKREGPLIRNGLRNTPLQEYLAALDRTQHAMGDLQNTNLRSNQQAIAELDDLLRVGHAELEKAFRQSLGSESQAVEPLHFITKQLPFPALSHENSSTLRTINSYMTSQVANSARPWDDARTASVYTEVRGPYVATTLANLATASVSTIRKTNPEAIYRQGTSGIGTYCKTLEKLFAAEYDNICPIFSREQWQKVHSNVCAESMNDFNRTLGDIHSHVKTHMVTDCFLAYETCEYVSDLAYRLEARNPDLKQPVQDCLRPIREAAKYSLQRLLEDTRTRCQNMSMLSPDAAPVQVTIDTMTRLQNMTQYLTPLSSILASVGEGNWRASGSGPKSPTIDPPNLDVGRDGSDLFAAYAGDTIDTLLSNLEQKAKLLFKSKGSQGIFMANNVFIVDRMINTSDLHNLLSDTSRTKLESWRKKSMQFALDAWSEPTRQLLDKQFTNRSSGNRPPSGSNNTLSSSEIVKHLTSKEKDMTKEKFRNFNTSFDELITRHKGFKMEPEVREKVGKEIYSMVEPLYAQFWNRYHEIDKGKGKYVKYDVPQLRQILRSLG